MEAFVVAHFAMTIRPSGTEVTLNRREGGQARPSDRGDR